MTLEPRRRTLSVSSLATSEAMAPQPQAADPKTADPAANDESPGCIDHCSISA